MSTIANAKDAHNYNRYNGYFFGCLRFFLSNLLITRMSEGLKGFYCSFQNVGTFRQNA